MYPFKEKGVAQILKTFDWLEEALDDEEKELFGKSGGDIEKFFELEPDAWINLDSGDRHNIEEYPFGQN